MLPVVMECMFPNIKITIVVIESMSTGNGNYFYLTNDEILLRVILSTKNLLIILVYQ